MQVTFYTVFHVQIFGSKVRVESVAKVAELEVAEKVTFLCSELMINLLIVQVSNLLKEGKSS